MDYSKYLRNDKFLDVSNWDSKGLETKGTRQKLQLVEPNTNDNFLFKIPEHPHETFNEVFNSLLCNSLQIHHVTYYNAIRNGKIGVLCKSFLNPKKDEELTEMREFLMRHSGNKLKYEDRLKGRSKQVQKEHNIELLFLILDDEFKEKMMHKFFQMIGFDALIGHTDRHWENYGFISSPKGGKPEYRFAPIYDTVSSYAYSDLSQDTLARLLLETSEQAFFLAKSQKFSKISLPTEVKINHFDLLEYIMSNGTMEKYITSLMKPFRLYTPELGAKIIERYFKKLDQNHAKLVLQILRSRKEIGLGLLSKSV